jgi:hypothetical protein
LKNCDKGDEALERRVLMGKYAGKWLLGIPKYRWDGDVKMDIKEIGYPRLWTEFKWLAVGAGGNEPSGYIRCWTFLEWQSNC